MDNINVLEYLNSGDEEDPVCDRFLVIIYQLYSAFNFRLEPIREGTASTAKSSA